MPDPVLQEIVERGGRLLSVAHEPAPGRRSAAAARRIVLVLDTGLLRIEPSAGGGELAVRLLTGEDPGDRATVSADEEEPWWALRGDELCGAWAVSDTGTVGVDLQFRRDDENPKIVMLRLKGSQVTISARPKADWLDSGEP